MKSFFQYNFSKFSKKPSISRNQFLFIKMLMLKELRLEEDHEEVIFLILLIKT